MTFFTRIARPEDGAEWLRMRKTLWVDCLDDQQLREMASDTELGNEVSHQAHGALGDEESARLVLFKKDLD